MNVNNSSSQPIGKWATPYKISSSYSPASFLPSYAVNKNYQVGSSYKPTGASYDPSHVGAATSNQLSDLDMNDNATRTLSPEARPQGLNDSFCEGCPKPSAINLQQGSGMKGVKLLDNELTRDNGQLSTQESSPGRKESMEQENDPHSPASPNIIAQPVSYGLPNLGNTCYMNSVLQCLFNNEKLRSYFIQGEHLIGDHEISLTESFVEMLSTVFSKHMKMEDITGPLFKFKGTLEKVATVFEGYAQNDAHEFFRLLIEKIHDELNNGPKRSEPYTEFRPSKRLMTIYQMADEWKRYSKDRDDSLITSSFGGILLNEVSCTNCKYVSYTFEDALDLSLNLANPSESSSSHSSGVTTLYTCLKTFITPEPVEGYACAKCKRKNTSFKRTTIWKQPENLVVQFKRFVYDNYGDRKAVKDRVSFPVDGLTLDYFTHEKSNEREGKYKLQGIVNHLGGLDNGHYIAWIYNEDMKCWLEYNDSTITRVEDKEVADFAQGSPEPYILFYKRV